MARKVMVVSVILVMLFVVFWSNKDNAFQPEVPQASTHLTSVKTQKKAINGHSNKTKGHVEKIKKTAKLSSGEQYQLEQLLKEVSNVEYSADPFFCS